MDTPQSERLHIVFAGCRNAGKSSLVNAMAGQQVSIVSDVPGTTTDPVAKAVEIPGLGPCILTDTAGLDDAGVLGPSRLEKARDRIAGADIVVLVCSGSPEALPLEQALAKDLERSGKPFVAVLGKSDLLEDPAARIDMEDEDEDGITCADVFVKGTYTTSVGAPCREEAVETAYEMAEDQEFGPLKGVAFIVKDVEPFPECLPF